MLRVADALAQIGVINLHDLLLRFAVRGVDDIAIDYSPYYGRGFSSHARVYSPNHATDPNAAWYNHGLKTFTGLRKEAMPPAIAWASERYKIEEWVPAPTRARGLVPATVRRRALAALGRSK
jgi:hypothetical protein